MLYHQDNQKNQLGVAAWSGFILTGDDGVVVVVWDRLAGALVVASRGREEWPP